MIEDGNEYLECFWEELQSLGRKHNEKILDKEAWCELFHEGKTASEAFFDEFPEHK